MTDIGAVGEQTIRPSIVKTSRYQPNHGLLRQTGLWWVGWGCVDELSDVDQRGQGVRRGVNTGLSLVATEVENVETVGSAEGGEVIASGAVSALRAVDQLADAVRLDAFSKASRKAGETCSR